MDSDTNILCGFDDAYAPHFATMISSLFAASRDSQKVRIHLIANLLSPAVRARLDDIVAQHYDATIHWLDVDCTPFIDAPVTMHFTRATYARIAAFNVLRADRVLYLDVDLLCLADPVELYRMNLKGNPVGAVLDPGSTFAGGEHNRALGIPQHAPWFNCGVMVVDTARWRKQRLTKICLAYLERVKSAIWWVDQDVLNGVLVGKWTKLPSVWNVQSHFWKLAFRQIMAVKMPAELDVVHSPKIVHFNDPMKPWHVGYQHPYREHYLQNLPRSGWPYSLRHFYRENAHDVEVKFGLDPRSAQPTQENRLTPSSPAMISVLQP